MSKKIENEPSSKKKETNKYYDEYINIKIREFIDKNRKYGETTNIMRDLAKACKTSLSTIKRCCSGYSTLKQYNQIKYFADFTGYDVKELLASVENNNRKIKIDETLKRELPKDLIIKGVELHNTESYNVLCSHTFRKGDLFPAKDNFLITLDYLICEEKFIDAISNILNELLGKFINYTTDAVNTGKFNQEEVNKMICSKNLKEFKKMLAQKDLKKLMNLIDIGIADMNDELEELSLKYIYENLKNRQ